MNYAHEWFHFYASLKPKSKLCFKPVLFFNELKNRNKLWSKRFVSFFNELDTDKRNYAHQPVSFFNELDTEKELCSQTWFHFYANLKPKG